MAVDTPGIDQRPLQRRCLAQGNDVVQLVFFQVGKECVVTQVAATTQERNRLVAQTLSGMGQEALHVVG